MFHMIAKIKRFLADESALSGVVVAVMLIVIAAFCAYYLYKGVQPGVTGAANNIGKVLQQQ